MKIRKILWILVLAISIVSCNKDDDGEAPFLLTNSNIAGTHVLTYLRTDIVEVFEINGIQITSSVSIVGSTFQVTFVFSENGTYTAEGEYLATITTTVAGQSNVETEIIVLDEAGTYQVNTNDETISVSDGTLIDTFDVSVFNENTMTWMQDVSETSSDGTIDTQTVLRFERQ